MRPTPLHRPHIGILSGAGISAESGLQTFRDGGGLWEGHRPEDVATPLAWSKDPLQVNRFYNQRRSQLASVQPNPGHLSLVEMETWAQVSIVTQNIDDLHERAGSTRVLHLHGKLTEARSSIDPQLIVKLGYRPIEPDEKAPDGSLLRPNVVWFGEQVEAFESAARLVSRLDFLIVVGTSLLVFPAASLTDYLPPESHLILVDPRPPENLGPEVSVIFAEPASTGLPKAVSWIKGQASKS
ncbi:MAG: Sir2 family NAD-dependent protein deacetylase [Puniceicoccaceae bacterium]